MQAIAFLSVKFVGSVIRLLARQPVASLLLVAAVVLALPTLLGPVVLVAVAGLKISYALVWLWWRYAPAASAAPSGSG